jgi:hypothetical protein
MVPFPCCYISLLNSLAPFSCSKKKSLAKKRDEYKKLAPNAVIVSDIIGIVVVKYSAL